MTTLSVIIPVFNEEKNISAVLEAVISVNIAKEIIVVDDCSTDNSLNEIQKTKRKNLKIISHQKNLGKGAAIRSGIRQATGEIILIQDMDMEYSPQDYYELVKPIQKGVSRVVYGSRFKGTIKGMTFPNFVANKILTLAANILFLINISDEATCYKVFDASLLKKQKLKCNRFDFCPEITAKLSKQGVKIFEVPIHYNGRTKSEGKKIRWSDGFSALWTLIKYRFTD